VRRVCSYRGCNIVLPLSRCLGIDALNDYCDRNARTMSMGDRAWYVGNVLREEALQDRYMHLSEFFTRLEGTVAQIIFVPDKYRVYAPLLDQPPAKPLPNRNWEYLNALAQQHQIPALNLYPALSTAAKQALERSEYVYWRGDTHWNCLGMKVAATVLSEVLNNRVTTEKTQSSH